MKISDILQETLSALLANRVRSGLTILGIVIGIGSVISMLAIGQGAQGSIEESIQSIGSNLIMISPGAQRSFGSTVRAARGSAQTLTLSDVEVISQKIASVEAVSPEVSGRYQVVAKGNNTNTQVVGTSPEYTEVRSLEMANGYFITTRNINNNSKVAVLGPDVRDDLFGEDVNAVGQIIKINKIEFKVIGITATKGGSGFGSQDDMIFIPLSTAQKFLSGNKYVTAIYVAAKDAESTTAVQENITSLLLNLHNITDATAADFTTVNQADIIETASSVASTFTILLGAIAGISLLVGGIGIMNMMLMTVTERTREIGLRKAIGAKRKDVSVQFLTEAVALTLVSGLLGVILGCGVAFGLSYFNVTTTTVTTSSVLLAFGVSALIGIIFGYYPARRASGLNPIEALRYE